MLPRPLAHLLILCVLGCVLSTFARSGLFDASQDQIHATTLYRSISAESFDLLAQKTLTGDGPMLLDTFMASGIRTICELPEITFANTEEGDSSSPSTHPSVASFLTPLRDQCMRYLEGWWTYEFCIGKQLRQYHADPQGKVEKEYILGSALHKSPVGGSPLSASSLASMSDEDYLSHLESLKLDTDASLPYYSESFDHGTPCDVTGGVPRQFEARWSCSAAATSTSIRSVKEPSSCRYILELESPLICQHPSYRSLETPSYVTTCYFIDQDAISASQEHKGILSSKEKVALDQQWTESNFRAMNSHVNTALDGESGSTSAEQQKAKLEADIKEASAEIQFVRTNIPGVTTGATFVMRPVEDDPSAEDYLRALQTSAILRDTVRERADQKIALAVLHPHETATAPTNKAIITEEDEKDVEIVTGEKLEQLLGQLTDSELLTLLGAIDQAIAMDTQERAALKEEGIEFDEEEKIVIEIDTTGHPLPWDHNITPDHEGSDEQEQKKKVQH